MEPDVSPENDGNLKLEYATGFGGPQRKVFGAELKAKLLADQLEAIGGSKRYPAQCWKYLIYLSVGSIDNYKFNLLAYIW